MTAIKRKKPADRHAVSFRTISPETHQGILNGAGARRMSAGEFIARLLEVHAAAQQAITENKPPEEVVTELREVLKRLGMEQVVR